MNDQVAKVLQERGELYNSGDAMDPETNFFTAYRLAEEYELAINKVNRGQARAHTHAMRMVLMKIARIATGVPNAENYLDAIGYLELAQRIALREEKGNDQRNVS